MRPFHPRGAQAQRSEIWNEFIPSVPRPPPLTCGLVLLFFAMTEDQKPSAAELEYLRTTIHELNNCVGVILTTSELLGLDAAEGKVKSRCELIEKKALEASSLSD